MTGTLRSGSRRLLVVEDDDDTANLLTVYFSSHNYEVRVARSGADFKRSPPSEILAMKHAAFSAAGGLPSASGVAFKKPRRIRWMASLLETLHHSRRLQARQFLRAHRHLIHGEADRYLGYGTGDENVDC